MEQARWACTIDIKSRYPSKEGYSECLMRFHIIVYFELLPRNQTINSNNYCRQLMKLDKGIQKKRPELATRKGFIFRQDNARPHRSEYNLFCPLQNHLNEKIFYSNKAVKISWFSFLPLRTKLSTKAELWSWLKDGKRSSNKMANT